MLEPRLNSKSIHAILIMQYFNAIYLNICQKFCFINKALGFKFNAYKIILQKAHMIFMFRY